MPALCTQNNSLQPSAFPGLCAASGTFHGGHSKNSKQTKRESNETFIDCTCYPILEAARRQSSLGTEGRGDCRKGFWVDEMKKKKLLLCKAPKSSAKGIRNVCEMKFNQKSAWRAQIIGKRLIITVKTCTMRQLTCVTLLIIQNNGA